ncbi:MAG: AraC family transcriptional regulator [Azospirillaceae bacterium]|nr:AraC family transcriptional regulator [Azospirillaceae bacterium]
MAHQSTRSEQTRPATGNHRILAAAASGVATFIADNGADPERVFAASGIDPACLTDPLAPLGLSSFVCMMEQAARQSGNDNFGLWYGHRFRPEMQGQMGKVVLASATVGAALANMAEMFPYHQHATECRLIRAADGLMRMEYRILDPSVVARRQDAELTLGMVLNVCRHALGAQWTPERVEFEHLRPEGWLEHERAFGAEVIFGWRTNAVVFRSAGLDRRMPGANAPAMAAARRRMVSLGSTRQALGLDDVVMNEVRARLHEGYPHIEVIAASVGVPRWTLQRRLVEAGLTFSEAVERVRRDMATFYLGQAHLSLSEIALSLGYSELSAFTRAFSRWHGVSPAKWRQQAGHGVRATLC